MDVIQRIEKIIEPALHALGYDLVHVSLGGGGSRQVLLIMIENQDQTTVSIDDCVRASRELSVLLDIEDPISTPYNLEVSSPGFDRPLVKIQDFMRFQGNEVKIQTHTPIENRKRFKGTLVKTTENHIILEVEGHAYEIPYQEIRAARLVPNFQEIEVKPPVRKR